MSVIDGLQSFLKFLAPVAGQVAGGLGQTIQQVSNPSLFAQQQENARQQSAQDAASAQHDSDRNSLSLFQQASLAQQSQQQQQEQNLNLAKLFQSGAVREATVGSTNPNQVDYGGKKLEMVPPEEQAGMFTYKPTSADLTNNPWMSGVGTRGITMPVREFPNFLNDMGKIEKNAPVNTMGYESNLNGQLDELLPDSSDSSDQMKKTYKFLIHDALNPVDQSKPDFKRAFGVIDDIRKDKEAVNLQKQKIAAEFSPEALAGAAKKKYGETTADLEAQNNMSKVILPDSSLNDVYRRIKMGQLPLDQAARQLGLNDKFSRSRWLTFLGRMGDTVGDGDMPTPLDQSTRTRLGNLEPVISSLDDLQKKIAPIAGNKAPGALAASRMLYALGAGDENSGLISQMEMDRLRGAAQALPGGRAALQTFEQAQLHTPSAWMSSGYQANEQISNMLGYLRNQQTALYKYGNKYGVVDQGKGGVGASDEPDMIVQNGKVIANPNKHIPKVGGQ